MEYRMLVDRLAPALWRMSQKVARKGGGADPEDLYQEGLLWLWEGHRRGAWRDRPEPYILGGCRFHLQNRRRMEAIRRRREVPLPAAGDPPSPDPADGIDRRLLVGEMLSNGLRPAEKQVLRLRYEGLTVREVGDRMGLSHVRVVKLQGSIRAKWQGRYEAAEGRGTEAVGRRQ